MQTINRLVAIIKPKQPFLDWLESLTDWDDELTLDELREDCTAILIPEYGSNEKASQYIEQKYEEIFEIELSNWHYDKDLWIKNRSLQLFRQWFDVEIHSMVYDAVDGDIIKED